MLQCRWGSLDKREAGTIAYEAGLSGRSWLLSSIAANDWPTISSLIDGLWAEAFQDSLLLPDGALAALTMIAVTADIVAKEAAGFPPKLTVNNSPYEFGSFDQGVAAFADTKYLGSSINNGQAATTSCVAGFDSTGLILGTNSNLFNEVCAPISGLGLELLSNETVDLQGILNTAHEATTRDEYAAYPYPFYNYSTSSLVSAEEELHLVDGGEALQNNPIWPFLHRPAVDVLIVNDNSADTSNDYPNGSEILTTYVQAQAAGLTRMPAIPSVSTFLAQGLNIRPTFFGCNSPNAMTIIYLPNPNYTYNSGQSTAKLQYTEAETRAMVANGVQIGSFGGNSTWAECLACGIMAKSGVISTECTACLAEFCYN